MSLNKISSRRRKLFADHLLQWYARNKRDLPWRRDAHDPYRVWISETLLQQTQVTTVIPYYERFVSRFPNVRALASARLDTVLKSWEGAGYYSRARNLHRAAQEIVERFGGRIPDTVEALLTLPGIGRYTAGAIASIAFSRDTPVLDGNVARVLCRVFNIQGVPRAPKTEGLLWELVAELLPSKLASKFNQALMDLGATVCSPRRPVCPVCPLKRGCAARRMGIQERLPTRRPKKQLPHYDVAVGIVRKGNKILIAKRFADDLLGGLWEFPGGRLERGETLAQCVRREVREELEIGIAVGQRIAIVEHAYSHFRITMHAFECRWRRGHPRALGCAAWKWVRPRALSRYAFPAATRKIIAMLRETNGG